MLKVITDRTELFDSKKEWNELVQDNPFFRWEWMVNWVKFSAEIEPMVVVLVDDFGRWRAMAPFCRQTSRTRSRRIRFIGSGKVCSDYLNVVCDASIEDEFISELAAFLREVSTGKTPHARFNLLELEGVASNDRQVRKLIQNLEEHGFHYQTIESEGAWVADLPSDFAEMYSQMSKSMRRKVRAAEKRLDDEETTVFSSESAAFDGLWKSFVVLHQQRREMLGQPGCFEDSEFEEFLKTACHELVQEGLAELNVIEKSGKPFATSLSFISNQKWMMYQTGFDVSRYKESPGYQIVLQAIHRAIERGCTVFDFLRGDEPYKSRWLTDRVELAKLRIIPPTGEAIVRNNLWSSAKAIKYIATTVQENAKHLIYPIAIN